MHHHIVYETRCLINGNTYIGVHTSLRKKDRYLGSGEALLKDIKKYGRKNFKRRTIMECDSREECFKYEAYFVDKKFIGKESTYNSVEGGSCPLSLAEEWRKEIKQSFKIKSNFIHRKTLTSYR